jgi:hypothetical protein
VTVTGGLAQLTEARNAKCKMQNANSRGFALGDAFTVCIVHLAF